MTLTLRDYQIDLVERCAVAIRDHGSTVMQLGTGGGKTATASEIIRRATQRGKKIMFCAHLDAIIGDTQRRLTSAGVHAGYVQAGRPSDPTAAVQVCSTKTLANMIDRGDALPDADGIIYDECHRSEGAQVRAVHARYPDAWRLGLTATPMRGDGKPLGGTYASLVCGPSNAHLVSIGALVPVELIAPTGDTSKGLVCSPVEAYLLHGGGRRAVVFCDSVAHAKAVEAEFLASGISAALYIGTTARSVRDRRCEQLSEGTLRVLIGVAAFCEGLDVPPVEVCVLARGIGSLVVYLQGIGRTRRPSPSTGKTHATVIDLAGSWSGFGLPDEARRWSIEGKACIRTAPIALRRCKTCWAVFASAVTCPSCGARGEVSEAIPRVLNRAETLARVEHLPQRDQDARYLKKLEAQARRFVLTRIPQGPARNLAAKQWALKKFEASRGRKAVV